MKTLKSNTKNGKSILLISLACSAAMFITGCAKEQLITPVSQVNTPNGAKMIYPQEPFTLIKIDHNSGLTAAPNYSVSVGNNGWITYEGRANVAFKGIVGFRVPHELIIDLNVLYHMMTFNERNTPPGIPEHPIVITTYFDGRHAATTYTDFNTGSPAALFKFRTKVEELLSISKYVAGIRKIESSVNAITNSQ
ncbi:MAG: hypothetical protein ABIT08_13005 [Bacteroidia bacterium]